MSASQEGYLDIIKFLITFGKVDPNQSDSSGWTSLLSCAARGHLESLKYLVEVAKADPNKKKSNGWNALMAAA